jgi:hypothetical protein
MENNRAKLMGITITTLTSIFIITAIAMADPPGLRSLRGQYAATGSQTCLLAQCGFLLPNYVPRAASYGFGSINSFSLEGIFKIEPDGTGEASIIKRSINFAPTSPDITSASAGVVIDTWSFTSTVAGDGSYMMKPEKDSYISKWTIGPYVGSEFTMNGWVFNGNITPDGKTITLNTGVPTVATLSPAIVGPPCPKAQLICNTSLVLIWQHDINEE